MVAQWILSFQPNSSLSTDDILFNIVNSLQQDINRGANSSFIQSLGINSLVSQLSTVLPGIGADQLSAAVLNALLADMARGQNSTLAQSITDTVIAVLSDVRGLHFSHFNADLNRSTKIFSTGSRSTSFPFKFVEFNFQLDFHPHTVRSPIA